MAIGQQSRNDLGGALARARAAIGAPVGMSYGRPVAPVEVGGEDLGLNLTRQGSTLAAPDFLRDDPQRRFEYLQAERLARLNRLGVHDTMFQPPAEFRKAPMPGPSRETVAQFWDTPTPLAGMRPELEQQFIRMANDPKVPIADVVAFAHDNGGFTVDPANVEKSRAAALKLGLTAGVEYAPRIKPLTDLGDGTPGAVVRGGAQGVVMNQLEELGALPDTLGLTQGRESIWNSDRRFADIYANNLAQNEAITGYDRFAHPWASTGAEVVGGLALPMGRVRNAADLAKFGALYGGVAGLGQEGTIPERLTSGVVGAGMGLGLTVGGTKALEALAPRVANLLPRRRRGEVPAPPDGYSLDDVTNGSIPRQPDRIDIYGPSRPFPAPLPSAVNSAYPGPVAGQPRTLDDITGDVQAWARDQGIGDNLMLHGSRTPGIEQFDPYQYSNYGLFGQGTYLTDHPAVALGYTGKGARGADPSGRTIYAVEQTVKNPLDLDAPANPAAWSHLSEQYGFDIHPGMSNEHAYKALEEALADEWLPKWEGAEIMADAVRSMGHDGLTHIGGGRYGNREAPRHRVMIALDPEQAAIKGSLDVGELMRTPMRDRNWIDISEVPPPPEGFTLDRQGSMGMDAQGMPSLSAPARQPDYLDMGGPRAQRMDAPLADASRQALARDLMPSDLLPIPSNQIGSAEEAARIEAGRYAEARVPNERTELGRRTVRAWNGAEVPKVGPIDMVGWLRTQGGLLDQGGELSHMGLTNAARKMDFAGSEQRFGPLVNNDSGMNLDDAAMRAWEAGYFPDHTDRPSVNEFLDALRDTHEGRNRRFLPDDYPEIDRFYGTQADRYALQQQRFETGQPVYADRSVPAEEAPPLPPVQAYEEWPAGGPDFAGNINLTKLETPQDISRALDMTNRRVGFDAATRGRVSHAEMERLASDLGLTADALLARRKGQAFNAEEALAARQILAKSGNELVNLAKRVRSMDEPGDDVLAAFREAWLRHTAIQEQVSGMTAEAGRALSQFRMLAKSNAVPREVLSSLIGGGGGRTRVQDAADLILDAVEQGPGKFNVEVERLAKPAFKDKATELYINSLLSGPQTHAANIASNTLTALAQLPEHATAAAIGKVRSILPGANIDRVVGSEIGARTFGLIQGAKEGARFFLQALRTGEPVDFASKFEQQSLKAISGRKGEIIRIPTRLLTAEDEFFKGIARRMELNGLAVRQASKEGLRGDAAKARIAELAANPTDEMLAQSMEYARYLTFQQKLGPGMSKLSGMTQDIRPLKLFLPFIRTPTNLLKFAVERSPAAPLLKEWRADIVAGGARRDLAVAKAMLGTGLGAVVYQAALEGRITGSPPTDPARAKLLYADGWQPYSIRVGDQWFSYKRLDPFSTTLGIAADLALLPEGMSEGQRDDQATLLVASILGNLASKTWLSGISGLVGALTEPDRKADAMVNQVAGSVTVPAGVAQLARTMDPVRRDPANVGEAILSRLPRLSRSLPAKRDVWGRPITNEGGIGPDIASPVYTSTLRNDPVNKALLELGYAPGAPKREVAGRKLSADEYARYQAQAGRRTLDALAPLVKSPAWRGMDAEAREESAKKAVASARAAARADLGLSGKPKFGLIGSSTRNAPKLSQVPPPPPGFSEDGAAGGVNVYADLQRVIPGIRITSGFRTPEYQAEMRRRGYHPAQNSAHLDGSALDLLPPPGKPMSWLKDRVRAYDPNARLLNEGDHLHVTFPGYYGAPALGGARAAKLRNPNAGLPPPPPGFKLD
ncbi:MAG: hypothetical protein IT550_08615 [Novosphingobium sp.]|nr:hypothetical protein [Novosphingobium sp.]